ncbi:MAG: hypothetical protein Q7W56_03375 [Candidatus Latescibacteria bacterium]|nr:hypothetical protein [Candidatus Latescibacterota bacterium]
MKKIVTMLVLAFALLGAGAALAGEKAWLDLENCGMCKNLLTDKDLFEHMTWDTYLLSNGSMEVTTYPASYDERFKKLMATFEACGAKMMSGEQIPMCGMCNSYGQLMMAGAKMDQVQTKAGWVTVMTSQDPKVVAMIRTHAERTIEEYAKYAAANGGAHEHAH